MLLMPPILRRCPLRRPHDAETLLRSSSASRSSAPSARRLVRGARALSASVGAEKEPDAVDLAYAQTSALSAVMQSMEELIDHAAMGKRREQAANATDVGEIASPFAHTSDRLSDFAAVHPTAVVDPRATLGRNVRVGPYSVVGPDVVLEDGVVLQSHVVVEGRTRIGSETVVHPFACLGGEPQDKKHNPLVVNDSFRLEIGRNCMIREHVTIHGSTSYSTQSPTSLGDNCWVLCGAHVGHDAQIGSHVVLSNNVCVAGHVEIGSFAIIGGQVGLKQFIKVGSLAMIGGGSAVDGDVLPYGLVSGNRAKLLGLNLVGLRRAKISRHQIKLMLRVVRYLFGSSLTRIATVCPKTGFAPALDLPHHDSVILRAFEAKRYLTELEITTTSNPFVHEIVDFVLLSPDRPKSSLCNSLLH